MFNKDLNNFKGPILNPSLEQLQRQLKFLDLNADLAMKYGDPKELHLLIKMINDLRIRIIKEKNC